MLRFRKFVFGLSLALTLGSTSALQADQVTVFIENLAPARGTWHTPFWVGLHNGTFDTHDLGGFASEAIERLAEDGDTGPISNLFDAASGAYAQATIVSETGIPPFAPGETFSHTFNLDPNTDRAVYLSFLSMVIPSNDAFIGNEDAQAYPLFLDGVFQPLDIIVNGSFVKDAGTEDNDEIPENTAFLGQTVPNTGVGTEASLEFHSGFQSESSGNILSNPDFANADFTGRFYQAARIVVYEGKQPFLGDMNVGTESPIHYSEEGGAFIFEADVTNVTDRTLSFQAWTMVTLPNGFQFGPLIGPSSETLKSGETLHVRRIQTVPAQLPAGAYLYRGYVGLLSSDVNFAVPLDQDYLTVIKESSNETGSVGGSYDQWMVGASAPPADKVAAEHAVRAEVSPNPFNPSATIRYALPEAARVNLAIYDISGRQVAQLVDGVREAGTHEVTFDGSNLASGVYLYRLQTGSRVMSGKMMLLK